MRKQAAKIKVNVISAAFLAAERDFFKTELTEDPVSDKVSRLLDDVWFYYEQFETKEVLNKLDENIRLINEAIEELVKVQTRSVEPDDMLDYVFLEKAVAELDVARIVCHEEKIHYTKCKEGDGYMFTLKKGEN